MNQAEQLEAQITELQSAILSAHPSLPILLQTIHRNLKADPELVTLLSDEQIGVIVNGLSRQTQTQIATSISTGKKGKSIKSLGLDDL
jgi:hypothetical protein